MKSIKNLLVILFVLFFLTACAKPVIPSNPSVVLPPQKYLQDCPVYQLEGDDIEASLIQSKKNKISLYNCNLDKKALRTWYEQRHKLDTVPSR